MKLEILIGYTNDQQKPQTKGTGFIVLKNERKFVVTCRHVIDGQNETRFFAIPNCRKHVFPKLNEMTLSLTKPIFHPNDDLGSSYDIAIFEILKDQAVEIESFKLVEYDALSKTKTKEGSEAIIRGYSVSYLTEHFDPDSDDYLSPESSKGNVEKQPLDELNISGFSRKVKELQFIKSSNGNVIEEGTSGGPVWSKNGSDCIGMLIASVNAEWMNAIGQSTPVIGGAFVSSIRIRETIDSIS
jgi:hypothetical protein